MALNDTIAGRVQGPDFFGALQRGLVAERLVREAPLLEEANRQRNEQRQFEIEQAPIIAQQEQQRAIREQTLFGQQQGLISQKQDVLTQKSERETLQLRAQFQVNIADTLAPMTPQQRQLFVSQLNPDDLATVGITPEQVQAFPLDDQSIANFGDSGRAFLAKASAGKEQMEIRKETRSALRTEVEPLKSMAAVLHAGFEKVNNLAKLIRKGNRISVTSAITALVKIGDPGSVVSGNEIEAAVNNKTPVAALAALFTSKGVSDDVTQSILSRIDPLSPENIKVEDLLSTADALLKANIPGIQSRFASTQERAAENLTPGGIRSIFNKGAIDSIARLSDLKFDIPEIAPVSEKGLLPAIGKSFSIGGVEIRRVK